MTSSKIAGILFIYAGFYLWDTSFHHVTQCRITKSNAKCEVILCTNDDVDDDGDDDHDKGDDVR